MTQQQHRIFGIRHHGPGSARALLQAFEQWQPDSVLIEGPPEGASVIQWLNDEAMEPPVAMLVYRPDEPKLSQMLPFLAFSPEYQAARYALEQGFEPRFIDLPVAHRLAVTKQPYMPDASNLNKLAEVAGYPNYERWWNAFVEQRHAFDDLFEGLLEMVGAAREALAAQDVGSLSEREREIQAATLAMDDRREAQMRQHIRNAYANKSERIAVVVGAWHGPALVELGGVDAAAADAALLEDLETVEVEAAWIPWTYSRMAAGGGYGAGILSPGWYHHLWESGEAGMTPAHASGAWLTRVAHLLRDEGIDASSAHIIETVRLAEALAALRGLPLPGLPELSEATMTVMLAGDAAPMKLIERKLVISERMGGVPSGVPLVPLQRDLRNTQKRLELRPHPDANTLVLDLRDEQDLQRSYLLRRLNLLNIPWGQAINKRALRNAADSGTFRESWRLKWQPDYEIRVIEANLWGNTVVDAVLGHLESRLEDATLQSLTEMLDKLLLADMPEGIELVMQQIEVKAAASSDVPLMIDALPGLVRILRYGSVRQTDKAIVERVVDGLVTRICINLPSTVASLDDDAASEIFDKMKVMHGVVSTLNDQAQRARWHGVLAHMADTLTVHNLLRGRASRMRFDAKVDSAEITTIRMDRALNSLNMQGMTLEQLLQTAFWIEGFLRDSGLILLHDRSLWALLDSWVQQLKDDKFTGILPLLRRTFSSFSEVEREQLQDKARGLKQQQDAAANSGFDHERADAALPAIARLIGLVPAQ